MKELDDLLKRYKENLEIDQQNLENFMNINFPDLNLDQDILEQINLDIIVFYEKILNKLSLSELEEKRFQEAFDYFRLNMDLDLKNLIVRDFKCLNFLTKIKELNRKVEIYRQTMINNYQREIEKCKNLIKPFDTIKGLFQSTSEIDIYYLNDLLNKLSFNEEFRENIIADALKHNFDLTKTNQEEYQEESELSEEVEIIEIEEKQEDLNIQESDVQIIDLYLDLIDDLLEKIKLNPKNPEQDHLNQARLIELRDKLLEAKENSELCQEMLNEASQEEITYLGKVLKEIVITMKNIIDEVSEIADEYQRELEEEIIETEIKRNLIFLNSTFKDLEEFKKEVCQLPIIKKLYGMLKHLQCDEILTTTPYTQVSSPIPINEYKVKKSKGTPRLFYQVIDGNVIVLLLGIEGRKKHSTFKSMIEGRITQSVDSEHKRLINSFKLAKSYPNEKCEYNQKLTNKEFLEQLLSKYQEVEQEFFEKFHSECYDPNSKMR